MLRDGNGPLPAQADVATFFAEAVSPRDAPYFPSDGLPGERTVLPAFEEVYEKHFAFVWKALHRLGVPHSLIEDAVQDVFVVVHRRGSEFEGRSSVKTWIFGIVVHTARSYRRRRTMEPEPDADAVVAPEAQGPHARAEIAEARRRLYSILDTLDHDRREVFVLMELSDMTAPEVAQVLGIKLNTVYSRLRVARRDFDAAVARHGELEGDQCT